MPEIEDLHEKITKAYKRMKEKGTKRKKKKKKGSTNWEPGINDKVLLRCQHTSDAKQGVISKSVQNYSDPSLISDTCHRFMNYVICKARIRGRFYNINFKPYLREPTIDQSRKNS